MNETANGSWATMPSNPPILLLDTNVWLDLYLPHQSGAEPSRELIRWSVSHDIGLAFPSSAILDVYRRVGMLLKTWVREERGTLTEADVVAIKRMAWDNVNEMQRIAVPIPVEVHDLALAAKYRDVHNDLEDDLVIPSALRGKANYLVTNDRALIKRSPVTALTPQGMLLALTTGDAQGTSYAARGENDWLYAWLSKEELGALEPGARPH